LVLAAGVKHRSLAVAAGVQRPSVAAAAGAKHRPLAVAAGVQRPSVAAAADVEHLWFPAAAGVKHRLVAVTGGSQIATRKAPRTTGRTRARSRRAGGRRRPGWSSTSGPRPASRRCPRCRRHRHSRGRCARRHRARTAPAAADRVRVAQPLRAPSAAAADDGAPSPKQVRRRGRLGETLPTAAGDVG